MYNDKKRNIDLLIYQFWQNGFKITNRKYGTYLSEPAKIGNYEIDILGKFKKDYAIGICLSEDDLKHPKLLDKISFLATRKTRFSNRRVNLFIGVPYNIYKILREHINSLDDECKKYIKVFVLGLTVNSDLFDQPTYASENRNLSFAH